MPIDLVLINPGGRQKIYQNLASGLSAVEPPVWALLLASYAGRRGFAVKILDANAEELSFDETAARALSLEPRLIAIPVYGHNPSASTQIMPGVRALCSAIKRAKPSVSILLLGGHVTALPEKTMREEQTDFVSDGEGAETVVKLLELMKSEGTAVGVPDLWKREGDRIIPPKTRAPLIKDLDHSFGELPWDLLPMHKYRAHNWHCFGGIPRSPYAALYTTLGCPYHCEFCCIQSPFKNGEKTSGMQPQVSSYRLFSPNWVLKQIDKLVKEYGVRSLKIADEMFVLNRSHVLEICEGLIARHYDLNLWAYARVDTAKDPFLLAQLKKAGFNWLVLGIEAASPATRADVDKNFDQRDINESVRRVQDAGIAVLANYIFGLPEDTSETMQQTLEMALDLNTEFANFYCAMAYPGSALYRKAQIENQRLSDDWGRYSQHSINTLPINSKHLKGGEVVQFRDLAFERYFNRPEFLEALTAKFGPSAVMEIQEMLSQTLERVPSRS